MEIPAPRTFRFGDFELDASKRLLRREGQQVALNAKTFDLLLALVERRGEVVSKDALLERVWPGQFVEEGNLTVQISALRKIFGERKDEHRFVVTVPGRGYSFVAAVEDGSAREVVVERHRVSRVVVDEADELGDLPPYALPQVHEQRSSARKLLLIGLPIMIVAGLGFGYWLYFYNSSKAHVGSVAVMPFVNESGNADLDYLSDGLTESLIGDLSQIRQISVKARSSTSRFKDRGLDLRQIGAELGVDALLTGRLVQRGDEVVLYVEVVDPATEVVIWKTEYHRRLTDIAALRADVSGDVASKLRARLSRDDAARLAAYQTSNSEAYGLYLKGRHFGSGDLTIDRINKSIDYFDQAIRLDPNYALAYVGKARAYMRLGSVFALGSPQDAFPRAREALLKAISLDDQISEAHGSLGEYYLRYEWNWPAAERELLRAVSLDPEDPTNYVELGSYYQSIGRFEDAVRARETARRLMPVVAFVVANAGYPHYYARRQEQAIRYYREALEIEPGYSWSHLWIGQSYLDLKMYPEAITEIERAVELSNRNVRAVATLGHAYAVAGRTKDAERMLAELNEREKVEYVSPYFFAVLYAGVGDVDKTFENLERAVMERHPYLVLLKVEPIFDALHADPRFESLVKRIGIPD